MCCVDRSSLTLVAGPTEDLNKASKPVLKKYTFEKEGEMLFRPMSWGERLIKSVGLTIASLTIGLFAKTIWQLVKFIFYKISLCFAGDQKDKTMLERGANSAWKNLTNSWFGLKAIPVSIALTACAATLQLEKYAALEKWYNKDDGTDRIGLSWGHRIAEGSYMGACLQHVGIVDENGDVTGMESARKKTVVSGGGEGTAKGNVSAKERMQELIRIIGDAADEKSIRAPQDRVAPIGRLLVEQKA